MMGTDLDRMLDGVKVLDMSRLLPGPAATWFLQSMGAQVDRVEGVNGDLTRHIPPYVDGVGAYFSALSIGKRSMQMNLRAPEASDVIGRLLTHYDVLVEGFKPGTLEAIGLNPSELRQSHPGLIVARLSGFGQTGPYAHRVGHDINYLALSGVLSAQAVFNGQHSIPAAQLADLSGAMNAAMGICAALYARHASGQGRVLDISLTESAMSMWSPMIVGSLAEARNPLPGDEVLTGGSPVYGTYLCSDGKHLALGAIEPKFKAILESKLGELNSENLIKTFREKPRDYWVELLSNACVTPVLTVDELPNHPQHASRQCIEGGMVNPPLGCNSGRSPELGEHGPAILKECGFTLTEIKHLMVQGVLMGDVR